MKLFKEPLSEYEFSNYLSALLDCVKDIVFTNDFAELNRATGYAHDFISTLSYNRFLEIQNKGDKK